ncbi:MAG TPA: hypothetical protein VK501_14870 [Baekduia sp.]|uniref:hypothetical protein n=1 Tax=Baekduia sp. TaxID=2600305 RepID=UPI002C86519B|nr:hypothetical protein [Baekduia sp.]HMJ35191.1 hypothetical protein [Baekduia sp.]
MHAALLHLARARESADGNPDHAFRPLAEIHQEAVEWRGFTSDDTHRMLEELVPEGLIESRSQHRAGGEWRATPAAVQAINTAYATRHPLTEDGRA